MTQPLQAFPQPYGCSPPRQGAKRWCYCSQVLAKSWTKLLSASTAKQIIIWFDFSFFFFPHVCAKQKKKRKNEKNYFLFYCSTVIAGRIQLGNNHHVNTYDNMLFFVFSFFRFIYIIAKKRKTQARWLIKSNIRTPSGMRMLLLVVSP